MGDRGLCPIGDDLQTVVHKPEEYAAKKKAVLSKIDPSKEFVQGGEIFCRRCRKVKSLDMPERGVRRRSGNSTQKTRTACGAGGEISPHEFQRVGPRL